MSDKAVRHTATQKTDLNPIGTAAFLFGEGALLATSGLLLDLALLAPNLDFSVVNLDMAARERMAERLPNDRPNELRGDEHNRQRYAGTDEKDEVGERHDLFPSSLPICCYSVRYLLSSQAHQFRPRNHCLDD